MLYLRELKKLCFSVVYLIFLLLLVFGWYKNFYGVTSKEIAGAKGEEASVTERVTGGSVLREPREGDASYGTKSKEIPEQIMRGGTDMLLIEYEKNSYATYPFGYYKEIVLNKEEQRQILNILCEITGLTETQLQNLPEEYFPAVNGNIIHPQGYQAEPDGTFSVKMGTSGREDGKTQDKTEHFVSQVSYDRFQKLMREAEDIIGRGSSYSMDMLQEYYGQAEMSYEEAVAEYEKTVYEDRVSNAFARLFCDYTGRTLGLFPVFVVVVFWMKDKKSEMEELIGCKSAGSGYIMGARVAAMVTAFMLPVILLSFESLIPLLRYSVESGIAVDAFAFLKYIFWWLFPTVLLVTAVGMFFTVLTASPLAVLVQGAWWFVDSGLTGLSGDTGLFTLMIRHNMLNGSEIIKEDFMILCVNRGLAVVISVLLMILAGRIYDGKRRGKLSYGHTCQKYMGLFKKRFRSDL